METIKLVLRGIGHIVHFVIPAGDRTLEILFDPDCGDTYTGLVMLSAATSTTGVIISAVILSIGNGFLVALWPVLLFPFICWLGGWLLYLEVKRSFG